MRTDGRQPCPPTRGADEHPDRAVAARQRPQRRACAKKQMRILATWTAVLQVVDQRLADVHRQRQTLVAIALAADHDLTGPPVDVA